MSLDATRWAWKQDIRPMAKLVLLSLENSGLLNFNVCCARDLAERNTGADIHEILDAFTYLERNGLISVDQQDGGPAMYKLEVK